MEFRKELDGSGHSEAPFVEINEISRHCQSCLFVICHKVAVVFVGFHSCDILFDLSCVGISAFWVMELDSLVGIV